MRWKRSNKQVHTPFSCQKMRLRSLTNHPSQLHDKQTAESTTRSGPALFAVYPFDISPSLYRKSPENAACPALFCLWMRSCPLPARLETQPGYQGQPVSLVYLNAGTWQIDLHVDLSSWARAPTSDTGCPASNPTVVIFKSSGKMGRYPGNAGDCLLVWRVWAKDPYRCLWRFGKASTNAACPALR